LSYPFTFLQEITLPLTKSSGYQLEGPEEEGRWLDTVDRDAKMLQCRNWKRLAQNRDAWRQRNEVATAQVGL